MKSYIVLLLLIVMPSVGLNAFDFDSLRVSAGISAGKQNYRASHLELKNVPELLGDFYDPNVFNQKVEADNRTNSASTVNYDNFYYDICIHYKNWEFAYNYHYFDWSANTSIGNKGYEARLKDYQVTWYGGRTFGVRIGFEKYAFQRLTGSSSTSNLSFRYLENVSIGGIARYSRSSFQNKLKTSLLFGVDFYPNHTTSIIVRKQDPEVGYEVNKMIEIHGAGISFEPELIFQITGFPLSLFTQYSYRYHFSSGDEFYLSQQAFILGFRIHL
ncbi:MAG: hypothetical protein GF372_05885 [Candidatus Marinimicrobia bacterium]|nr:hypothetical protein [Candidatus Neomarinimicrobiota bacterium]